MSKKCICDYILTSGNHFGIVCPVHDRTRPVASKGRDKLSPSLPQDTTGELDQILVDWVKNHGNSLEMKDYDHEREPFRVEPQLVAAIQAYADKARTDEVEFLYEIADADLKAKLNEIYAVRGQNIGLSFVAQPAQAKKGQ